MTAFDAARLAALSRNLRVAPRHLLVLLAQRVHAQALDAPLSPTALAAARAPVAAAESAAALLLTPIAAFALDETDHALAAVWPPVGLEDR